MAFGRSRCDYMRHHARTPAPAWDSGLGVPHSASDGEPAPGTRQRRRSFCVREAHTVNTSSEVRRHWGAGAPSGSVCLWLGL